jgi:hypothetical protein
MGLRRPDTKVDATFRMRLCTDWEPSNHGLSPLSYEVTHCNEGKPSAFFHEGQWLARQLKKLPGEAMLRRASSSINYFYEFGYQPWRVVGWNHRGWKTLGYYLGSCGFGYQLLHVVH